MKRFEFRFEAVAKVRRIEMERQARALAEAQIKVQQIENEIKQIELDRDKEVVRLKDLVAKGNFAKQMFELSESYRTGLKKKLNWKRHELRDAEQLVREERDKLIEKEKRRKVIEKVRERDFENYTEEMRRDETKRMDETAGLLWGRTHAPDESSG